jgi:MFS family permease
VLDVLKAPGALGLFLASCVARLPIGAFGLLLVLQTEELTGSYANAGLAAGAYAAGIAGSNPLLARLIDRRGQTLVLSAGCVVAAAAMTTLALLPSSAPLAVVVAFASLAGASQPPVGACMRALWPVLVDGAERRKRAYALESVALEVVYICGPVVIVAGIGALSLRAALLACAVFVLAGDLLFSTRATSRAWQPSSERRPGFAGALRAPAVRVIVVVFILAGLAIGAVEVAVPAALEEGGDKGAVGLVLAAWGIGSMLGGVVASRLPASEDPARRLAWLLLAWGSTHALAGVARSPLAFVALLLLAGATIAPTFVCVNGMLDRLVVPGTLTEAFTWTSTGMTIGLAVGSTLAGRLVASASPGTALALCGLGGAVAAVLAYATAGGALQPRPASA